MDAFGNNNFVKNSSFTPSSAPTAPPPPSEVKVRTMRSDLAAMAKSGGGLPRFENVKVAGLSLEKQSSANNTVAAKGKNSATMILAVIAALLAIGILGYLAYRTFFASASPQQPAAQNTQGQNPAAAPGNTGATTSSTQNNGAATNAATNGTAATTPFTHVSLFKQPADQVLTLTLSSGGIASSAADLQTFDQKVSTLLAASSSRAATMIEIDVKDANGNALSAAQLFSQANAAILDPAFLAANFNPDPTFFAYRDKNGFWAGYILSLLPGKSQGAAQSAVAQLESSPSVANLFLINPGTASPAGFTGSTVSSTAVRVLLFPGATPPAYFTYGWFQSGQGYDLILSTSENGFAAAAARL